MHLHCTFHNSVHKPGWFGFCVFAPNSQSHEREAGTVTNQEVSVTVVPSTESQGIGLMQEISSASNQKPQVNS